MDTVAIVGAGMMGSGIAEAVAVAGVRVVVHEPGSAPLARSYERIDASLAKAVDRGKLDADAAADAIDRIVEVIPGYATSPGAIASTEAFARQIGKHAIRAKDRAGFLVNLLLIPYLVSAVRLYDAGYAAREDIDDGMTLGCGHPMGPLALCDFIGLDVIEGICASLHGEYGREEYAAPPLLRRMVAAGALGRKTGHGFYDYAPARPAALSSR